MPASEAALAAVIGRIYDAGLGREDWSSVIGAIAGLVGRGQACLEYMNYNTGEGRLLGVAGYDGGGLANSHNLFIENDPWAHKLAWDFAGTHSLGSEILSERERKSTFLVNELCPVVGLETKDIIATFITRTCDDRGAKASVGALMIYSGEKQPTFEAQEVGLMGIIRPHLVKALEIQARLEAANALHGASLIALDALPTALWLVNGDGRIRFANSKALEIQSGPAFAARDGALRFARSDDDALLRRAIAQAAHASPTEADSGAFLTRALVNGRPLSVVVSPATETGAAGLITGAAADPGVFVSIADRDPRTAQKLSAARALFGLTEAEAGVLRLLAEGEAPADIAAALGVSVWTVRTHLKAVLQKTDTHSQRELVALLLGGVP